MRSKGSPFPVGKLPLEYLEDLLKKYAVPGERVLLGAGIGRDATVIDWGEKLLVVKTDPITFVTDEIGYYAVHINANDIACTGGVPRWFLVTLLLPEERTDRELVESIFSQIATACQDMGIGWVGGHTEITYGIDRPIVVGQMLGEVTRGEFAHPGRIQVGDLVILTKGIAIEAVSILAREKEKTIRQKWGEDFLRRCRNFLHDPGIGVLREAQIALRMGEVHAFHDPTEGGLATGLYELAQAAQVGLQILRDKIPIFEETKRMCEAFGLDPLGVIASGALVIVTDPVNADSIVEGLRREGVQAEIIGEVVSQSEGLHLLSDSQRHPLKPFERDELTKIF